MDSKGLVLTERGVDLMKRALTGTVIKFSHVEYGTGEYPEDIKYEKLESLVNSKLTLPIQEIKNADDGTAVLTVAFTNADLAEGFTHTETGIFVDDPKYGKSLYAVHYSSNGGYIPPGKSAYIYEDVVDYMPQVGRNVNVTATINNMVVLATKVDIGDHNTNPKAHPDLLARLATGIPEILFPADGAENIGETPIYRFRQFVPVFNGTSEEAIQVQIDLETGNFSNSVHDSGFLTTIAAGYEQPAGMLQAGETKYKIRYRRRLNTGQISEWSEVVVFETRNVFNYVSRPSNVSPSNGATGVMETPKLVSSAFAVVGDANDTHEATQYRMRIGDTVLHLSPELGAVIEYDFPAGLLLVSGDYVWEVRYKGAVLGWSEWSTATSFHTAPAFVTGDEAIMLTSWNGYVDASAAGVALAAGGVLRSNGVDQGDGEGNWTSCQLREKIRNVEEWKVDPTTTADSLVITAYKTGALASGNKLFVNAAGSPNAKRITAGNVVESVVNAGGELAYPFGGSFLVQASYSGGLYSNPFRGAGCVNSQPYPLFQGGGSGDCFGYQFNEHKLLSGLDFIYAGTRLHSVELMIDGLWTSVPITKKVNGTRMLVSWEPTLCTGIKVPTPHLAQDVVLISPDVIKYTCTDLQPALTAAPDRALHDIAITVATGPAGTAFTAGDFKDVAIAKATLGKDTDATRPKFILLESEKITPETPFRRVAIGASNLSKDSEVRIAETQCDTWKVGA